MRRRQSFPTLLEAFFIDRLVRQRQVEPPHSRELPRYLPIASAICATTAWQSALGSDADRSRHSVPRRLSRSSRKERDNSARSRNVRLAAIHSFFRYVALHAPEHSALAQRVLAMPSKRYPRRPIDFLAPLEVTALLAAPNLDTWSGRRDRALLLLAVQTGLRASELLGLRCRISCSAQRLMCNAMARDESSQHPTTQGYRCGAAQLVDQEHHGQPARLPFRRCPARR